MVATAAAERDARQWEAFCSSPVRADRRWMIAETVCHLPFALCQDVDRLPWHKNEKSPNIKSQKISRSCVRALLVLCAHGAKSMPSGVQRLGLMGRPLRLCDFALRLRRREPCDKARLVDWRCAEIELASCKRCGLPEPNRMGIVVLRCKSSSRPCVFMTDAARKSPALRKPGTKNFFTYSESVSAANCLNRPRGSRLRRPPHERSTTRHLRISSPTRLTV